MQRMKTVLRRESRLLFLGLSLASIVSGCVLAGLGAAGGGGASSEAVLLFGVGMHIEPMGAQVSSIALEAGARQSAVDPRRPDYREPQYFAQHVRNLLLLADVLERHGGRMTIQAQSPFTVVASETANSILADLEARGHEISLHFHEDAHLGSACEELPVPVWSAVMDEEVGFIRDAGVRGPLRYWSGGNLFPGVLEAAGAVGLRVNSDWKSPKTQATPKELLGVHPWRPAGGTDGVNVALFATHDPAGEIVFLPNGAVDSDEWAHKQEIIASGGEAAWLEVLKKGLLDSLAHATPGRVNAYHLTLHPDEFAHDPAGSYALIERFLAEVVDPLVASGKVKWATHSQVADAYLAWEAAHPGADPRSGEGGT